MNDAWIWERLAFSKARVICGHQELQVKFESLRKEVFEKVLNFTNINDLPERKLVKEVEETSKFIDEEITINPLDYYYSNSISRASKTMSECRQISKKVKKTG